MGRCAYIKSDGTQCKKNAMSGFDFCNIHLETKVTKTNVSFESKKDTNTKYMTDEIAETYNEFLSNDDATDLKQEIAYMRTLRSELMKLLFLSSSEASLKIEQSLFNKFADVFKDSIEDKDVLNDCVEKVVAIAMQSLNKYIPSVIFSESTIKSIQNNIELTSKVAERMKKISEGFTYKVAIDMKFLSCLVNDIIYPELPNYEAQVRVKDKLLSLASKKVDEEKLLVSNTTPTLGDLAYATR